MNKNKIRKILLAEDDPNCSSAMKFLLELNNYTVNIANNGFEAVIMAANEEFNLILMDNEMPVMNGIKAAKAIRETDKDVIIISISSRNDREYINECQVCGMNGHVPKLIIAEVIKNNELDEAINFMIEDGRETYK